MVIKKMRSPVMTVIQTGASSTSFSVGTGAAMWKTSAGKVQSPAINGEILAIATSFSSSDTDASLNVVTRDLASTNICLITDWNTNKAAAIRYPRWFPHSENTATAWEGLSGGVMARPMAGSLEFGVSAGTSADTCIVEIFYNQ